MGLFINNSDHPEVYKNKEKINEPNQVVSRQDYLTELINEQQKANAAFRHAFAELRLHSLKQEEVQTNQWNHVDNQLNDLRNNNLKQKEFENMITDCLQAVGQKNSNLETILENEALLKKEIIEKVSDLSDDYQEIMNRLDTNDSANHQLAMQMSEHLKLQKEAAEKMTKQEFFQDDVLKRLDNQDALIDKIARELNHIRTILFERTNYLATKIDDGFKKTSSYVHKLMTGSDQPLTFFLMNHKKEESNKQSDQN